MPQSRDDRVASLPHWARVAFAARCAERTVPLFQKAWPAAPSSRLQALETAVRLAQESATKGLAIGGLKYAVVGAVHAAEAALALAFEQRSAADAASDRAAACRVSFSAARAAASAAEAAMDGPNDSVRSATDALVSARQAMETAGSKEMLSNLEAEVGRLILLARQKKWTDDTPVAPAAFNATAEKPRRRPWWKFW